MRHHKISTPPINLRIEPKTESDQEKLAAGLATIALDDPTFQTDVDFESGRVILKGMGEKHLDDILDRLINEFGIEAYIGAPEVAYRETISFEAEVSYCHKRCVEDENQFAMVKMVITPAEPGEGYSFVNRYTPGSLPQEYIEGVKKGINSTMETGPVAGFALIDIRVALIGGKAHNTDSSAIAFEIAARACVREGLRGAGPKMLEPIMKVEVCAPFEFTDSIRNDLVSRRGQVHEQNIQGNTITLTAFTPMATLFGYINNLRSQTNGKGDFDAVYNHHAVIDNHDPDDDPPVAIALRA